jgi:hypothetical protein
MQELLERAHRGIENYERDIENMPVGGPITSNIRDTGQIGLNQYSPL